MMATITSSDSVVTGMFALCGGQVEDSERKRELLVGMRLEEAVEYRASREKLAIL